MFECFSGGAGVKVRLVLAANPRIYLGVVRSDIKRFTALENFFSSHLSSDAFLWNLFVFLFLSRSRARTRKHVLDTGRVVRPVLANHSKSLFRNLGQSRGAGGEGFSLPVADR